MALPTRVLFPIGYVDSDFRLVRAVSLSRSGQRLTNIVEYADPVWVLDCETIPMDRDTFAKLEAWWAELRGGLRSILYRYPDFRFPAGHATADASVLQTGSVQAVSNGNVLSVSGVAAGLKLTSGDLVTLAKVDERYVGRISAVSGAGTARTITIEPAIPFGSVVTGATVYFDRAQPIMRPVAGSFQRNKVTIGIFSASFQLAESRA